MCATLGAGYFRCNRYRDVSHFLRPAGRTAGSGSWAIVVFWCFPDVFACQVSACLGAMAGHDAAARYPGIVAQIRI
jgi:hypothetical protein